MKWLILTLIILSSCQSDHDPTASKTLVKNEEMSSSSIADIPDELKDEEDCDEKAKEAEIKKIESLSLTGNADEGCTLDGDH